MTQRPVIALFASLVTIWGVSSIAVKAGLSTIPSVPTAAFRDAIGAANMWALRSS